MRPPVFQRHFIEVIGVELDAEPIRVKYGVQL
jgi:hypothetical protein